MPIARRHVEVPMNASQPEKSSNESSQGPLFFISAGDPSGDEHAARLVEALSNAIPGSRFIGYAGPKTAATQCDVRFDLTQFAVMMLMRAILNLPNYLKLIRQAKLIFRTEKPDMVILVDFPSFNWKIAQAAKAAGIPVVYFMPPQIWGWGQWRVRKMRKYVDVVLSCFEFEHKWFREQGCRSIFIGHPFFEEIRSRSVDSVFLKSLNSVVNGVSTVSSDLSTEAKGIRYLTLLPGSRNQEITNNLEHLINIARLVKSRVSDVQPVFAAYNKAHADMIRSRIGELNLDYPVYFGKTPELLRAATCCLGVSGSVSIEALSLCKPLVVVYRISRFEYKALRFLKRVKFITLSNLLGIDQMEGETPFYPRGFIPSSTDYTSRERELMICPEFLSYKDEAEKVAPVLIEWFSSRSLLNRKIEELTQLKAATDIVERPIEHAAKVIKEELVNLRKKS